MYKHGFLEKQDFTEAEHHQSSPHLYFENMNLRMKRKKSKIIWKKSVDFIQFYQQISETMMYQLNFLSFDHFSSYEQTNELKKASTCLSPKTVSQYHGTCKKISVEVVVDGEDDFRSLIENMIKQLGLKWMDSEDNVQQKLSMQLLFKKVIYKNSNFGLENFNINFKGFPWTKID